MIPRQRVDWLDSNADRATATRYAAASRLAWLPVLRRDTDEVLGVVHPGDILLQEQQGIGSREWDLKTYLKPAPTIFEHTPLPTILEDFRTHPAPLAFVRDEYGSVVGVITPSELLSVLAGQMGDMPAGPEVCRRPDGSWMLPGRLAVDLFASWLGVSLPRRLSSATLGGLITWLVVKDDGRMEQIVKQVRKLHDVLDVQVGHTEPTVFNRLAGCLEC